MSILAPIYDHDSARIAVRAGDTEIDYARLTADIDALARHLREQGLEPGARIALVSRNFANPTYGDWLMQLAAIRAGLVHSTDRAPMGEAVDGEVGPLRAIVSASDTEVKDVAVDIQSIRIDFADGKPLADVLSPKSATKLAEADAAKGGRLLATSGTTGKPKLVHWSAEVLAARIAQVGEGVFVNADTVLLPELGFPTTAGYRYPLATWIAGGTVLLSQVGSAERDGEAARAGCNCVIASPYRLGALLRAVEGEWPDREARTVHLFGGAVPQRLRTAIGERVAATAFTHYGSTEAGSVAHGNLAQLAGAGAVGKPAGDVEVRIVRQGGVEQPAGTAGLIEIRSKAMVAGYVGQIESPAFKDGWFRPGDIGVLGEDGTLVVSGRTADTLNVGGAKLAPAPIERRLARMKAIRDVALTTLPDRTGMERLVVAVATGAKVPRKQLAQRIKQVGQIGMPFALVPVGRIPRNQAGKIDRKRLRAALARGLSKNGQGKAANATAKPGVQGNAASGKAGSGKAAKQGADNG